jgi:hypothetical protein
VALDRLVRRAACGNRSHREVEPLLCESPGTKGLAQGFIWWENSMLWTIERRPAIRTLQGWAISVLQEAGAIRECEQHGWMQDCADPHARERAFEIAREYPPYGISAAAAAVAIAEVLDSIGDTCPECPQPDA